MLVIPQTLSTTSTEFDLQAPKIQTHNKAKTLPLAFRTFINLTDKILDKARNSKKECNWSSCKIIIKISTRSDKQTKMTTTICYVKTVIT